MATSQSTIDTIQKWYGENLGRSADAGGLDYWANQLSSGASQDDVFKAFSQGAAQEKSQAPQQQAQPQSGGGLIDSAPSSIGFVDYGGQQVRNDASYMQDLERGAKDRGMSTQDYDKMLNPETYGARWGIPASKQMQKPATSFQTMSGVSNTSVGGSGPALLNQGDLTQRTIDSPTETVAGQMNKLLDEDGLWIQSNRARGQREAARRGLVNSSMAASAGEDAAINAALQIASPDAATYGKAADYNAALINQATMYNADTKNAFTQKDMDRRQQYALAEMEDGTRRWLAERQAQDDRYKVDLDYRRTMDANRDSLVSNILMTGDFSPDRKAALLEQLGMGTSAKRNPDGSISPGLGIAGAVYVIDSVAQDLAPAATQPVTAAS